MLGSAFPSSQFLTNKLLAPIDFEKARLIVEYGAGVGNISIELLRRMHKDAKLLVFELSSELAEFLKKEIEDKRIIVSNRSAADVEEVLRENNLGQADYIISGVPFSTIPNDIGKKIVEATKLSLMPEGKFLVYQFKKKVLELLKPNFKNIEQEYEYVNIPPLRIFYAFN